MANVDRAVKFYGSVVGLEFAARFEEPEVALFWIGGRGHSRPGPSAVRRGPQGMSLHAAFSA